MNNRHLSLVALLFVAGTVGALDISGRATTQPWKNWIGNLSYQPSIVVGQYYFTPTTSNELREIITQAAIRKVKIRVSGQRHSTPPLIVNNDKYSPILNTKPGSVWVLDLSCYSDLGANENETIILNKEENTVTVNAGVREDQLDAYLSANNYMLPTVTAGGFFSMGGMAAIDVHGATINSVNFSGNIVAYTVMGADGTKKTYDSNSPKVKINNVQYDPLQFHRVSLGALGVITSVTIKIIPRPFKNTLVASQERVSLQYKDKFIVKFKELFKDENARIETFYNPYAPLLFPNMHILKWSVVDKPSPAIANDPAPAIPTACELAGRNQWGSPYMSKEDGSAERVTENALKLVQLSGSPSTGSLFIYAAFDTIQRSMNTAINNNDAMWLDQAVRTMALSYSIPLPNNADSGLDVAWDALQVAKTNLEELGAFTMAAPMEFRFVRSDDSLLSGDYSSGLPHRVISVEAIVFVSEENPKAYPQPILDTFARIECGWSQMGGMPHQGKAYGFYKPNLGNTQTCANVVGTPPFNPGYINYLKTRRTGLNAFVTYQNSLDPKGLFCTDYLKALGVCEAI
jgi:FAD/FMN-containing dehydrogenase